LKLLLWRKQEGIDSGQLRKTSYITSEMVSYSVTLNPQKLQDQEDNSVSRDLQACTVQQVMMHGTFCSMRHVTVVTLIKTVTAATIHKLYCIFMHQTSALIYLPLNKN
jgi:hypothetical protein